MAGAPITIDSKLQITDDNTTVDGDIGSDGKPDIIIIAGQTGINGFHILNSSNNVIRGFNLRLFSDGTTDPSPAPIKIEGATSTGNIIVTNYIGTNLNGDNVTGTGNYRGIRIDSEASNNKIGDGTITGINLISGNQITGIQIVGPNTNGNQIAGNIIGLDISGSLDFGNGTNGIEVINSTGTIIGAPGDGRNLISGNNQMGIVLNNASNSVIINNYIGTNINGDVPVGNSLEGLRLENGSTGTQIGDGSAAGRNIISGNSQSGIEINNSNDNTLIGNYIGLTANGISDLGNTNDGIFISGTSTNNTIGSSGQGNVISGNNGRGITIAGDANFVYGKLHRRSVWRQWPCGQYHCGYCGHRKQQ